ncbi:MAG: HD-GYP domain-containing protein [Magnetococcales bacterium]|nr:HD-GYP domain-containing protein [Magnetococcales bacterium]
MIKKISVSDLQPGMHIHSIVDVVSSDPLLRGNRLVHSSSEVRHIQSHGVKELFIDTDKGDDTRSGPSFAEISATLQDQIRELAGGDAVAKEAPPPQTETELHRIGAEIEEASQLVHEASLMVGEIMKDARMGRNIDARPISEPIRQMKEMIERSPDAMIALALLRKSDDETLRHSLNVGILLMLFTRSLGMNSTVVEQAGTAGFLHDIGKIRIPDSLLNKKGKLNPGELSVIRQHVKHALQLLDGTPGLTPLMTTIIKQHHERIDGSGYPHGLSGSNIHKLGQMVGIVDVYDAITSKRSYRGPIESHIALREIMRWAGTLFTQSLCEQFIRCIGIYPVGSLLELRNGTFALVIQNNRSALLHPVIKTIKTPAGNTADDTPGQMIDLNMFRDQPGYSIVNHRFVHDINIDILEEMPSGTLLSTP